MPSLPPDLLGDLRALVHRLREQQQERHAAARVARHDWSGPARDHFDRTRTALDARLASVTDQLAALARA